MQQHPHDQPRKVTSYEDAIGQLRRRTTGSFEVETPRRSATTFIFPLLVIGGLFAAHYMATPKPRPARERRPLIVTKAAPAPAPAKAMSRPAAPAPTKVAPLAEETPKPRAAEALSAARRKTLRKDLLVHYEQHRFEQAVEAGRLLRDNDALDWEAALCFANALTRVGASSEALEAFQHFVRAFPDNRFVPTAHAAIEQLRAKGS